MTDIAERQPIHTEPPHIPNADVYETHRPGEWIAIADAVYADVVNHCWLEDHHLSFVGLESGQVWVHIETGWRSADTDGGGQS